MKLKTRYKFGLLALGLAALLYAAILGARIITYTNGYFGRGALDLALIRAVEQGDRALVRVLLTVRASPDYIPPMTGFSAVSAAAYRGDAWAVGILLDHGANPNGADTIVDNFSNLDPQIPYRPGAAHPIYLTDRPLFMAARGGHAQIVALLREHGARYEFIDALFLADESFVREALARDPALVQTFERAGPRMLNLAVEDDNLAAARLMLDLGVDPARPPEYGPSPVEFAQNHPHRAEMFALLKAQTPALAEPDNE
jgi:ankyrin repeat protein